jgi:hypothetical protein
MGGSCSVSNLTSDYGSVLTSNSSVMLTKLPSLVGAQSAARENLHTVNDSTDNLMNLAILRRIG